MSGIDENIVLYIPPERGADMRFLIYTEQRALFSSWEYNMKLQLGCQGRCRKCFAEEDGSREYSRYTDEDEKSGDGSECIDGEGA